jgi:predicted helicase
MDFSRYIQSLKKSLQRGSERTNYPALKAILDNSAQEIEAFIEEKGNKAGIPDFTVRRRDLLVGYVEAKEIGLDLDVIEKSEQLERYRESFSNLILTNYLEFRWYVEGKKRLTAFLGERYKNDLQLVDVSEQRSTAELINSFLNFTGETITSPEELAKQMARLTKAIKYAVSEALKLETEAGELHQLQRGFKEVLLPDLDDAAFGDMYAQTISYGLFAARVGHQQNPGGYPFERRTAGLFIPPTNPFLKRLFDTVVDTDAISKINWAVDNLVQLLAQVDMGNILENFGRRTRQEDPVVHFYETFLAAYDAALRKSRGVYYTPEPVVSFIVRSVDLILKDRFNLPLGLADNAKDKVTQQPRVQILDPATGTGTFLYAVVNQIYQNLEEMGLARSWNDYVKNNLLSRLFGFELLMAPYSIAHLKLGWQLQNLGYEFTAKQRLGIYLTNTLDEALKQSEVLFGQFVANEANEAANIKRDVPVMVVLGNPPYSGHSANKGEWIDGLIRDYYKVDGLPLGERNPKWLQDDYVKFIRFGQWRINQTGFGVLAFVTNHGYIDNPTFRGMRQSLMQSFSDIYILDLHGNAKKKEVCPDGSPDQNVFDIQQGVSIGIFVKEPGKSVPARVYHADLWGSRADKYEILNRLDVDTVEWENVQPNSPFYLLSPQNRVLQKEYNEGWKITDIMLVNSVGIVTARDSLTIKWSAEEVESTVRDFVSLPVEEARQIYSLGNDTRDWKVSLAQADIRKHGIENKHIVPILYRPFDERYTYYTGLTRGFICMPRSEVMRHIVNKINLVLITTRKTVDEWGTLVNQYICSHKSCAAYDINNIFPLYLYPDTENEQGNLFTERTPNLSSKFLSAIRQKLGYIPTQEAIFYYAYAIFHSPTYRQRYAEFLKIDFPRLPLTSDDDLFRSLAQKGEELVKLHLMESKKLNKLITKYQGDGNDAVTQVTYKETEQRVYINKEQYFAGIPPEVWEFKIGGYQVLEKWLKDRKNARRSLSFDDILHYQRVVVALKETREIMGEIDELIPGFPLE